MNTIARVEVFPVGLPVTRGFRFSSGTAGAKGDKAWIVLVKLTDSEGRVGWGEGRPMRQWAYETIETAVSTLRDYLAPAVLGCEVWDRAGLHRRMHAAIGRGPSTGQPVAKAALDIAVHDLCAKIAGVPLCALLGGSGAPHELPLSWTCTAHTEEEAKRDVADGLAGGFKHFNFKAAVTPETDLILARTIAHHAPAGAFLWADCNQGLKPQDAIRVAEEFYGLGVGLLEQPFPADQMHLMERLRARTSIPLAIDESSVSAGDFFAYTRAGLVDYLVLKVTRSGGIWPTQHQVAVAESAALPSIVSGLTDGLLTKLAVCHVAAACGVTRPLALNGSQFLDESALYPQKSRFERDGSVFLSSEPGLGVEPDEAAIRALGR
jgi:muconate cycloisomerase